MEKLSHLICFALSACVAVLACSCERSNDVSLPDGEFTLVFTSSSPSGSLTPDIPSSVAAAQFSDSLLYADNMLAPDASGRVGITAKYGSHLYFISGVDMPAHSESASEESLLSAPIRLSAEDGTASDFLYGSLVLPSSRSRASGELALSLRHGVARVDIDVENPERTVISEVVIENAPAYALPFSPERVTSDETVRLTRAMAQDFDGEQEGLFHIFSSTTPVHFVISGTQDGVPASFRATLPSVERGKIYELAVLGTGADVQGTFSVRSWEDGATVVAKPDTWSRILLSSEESSIPSDVTVDYGDNTVSVPNTGASEMTLAFVADAAVEIASVEGLGRGAVVDERTMSVSRNGRYVSSFKVSIPAQGKGRLGYSVLVNLRYALLKGSYDCVRVNVAPSDKLVETVDIAGRTWMAFNGVSPELDSQTYLMDGIGDVESMYKKLWTTSIGYLFQYGRPAQYVPWRGYNTNSLNSAPTDKPWQTADKMPCPEGWRLPTRSELLTLLPNQTLPIPGSYTSGGDTISAELMTAEEETVKTETNISGVSRILKLTSGNSGQSMYLPFGGEKSDKSQAANPGFGNSLVLWTSEYSNTGGYAYGRKVSYVDGETKSVKFEESHRPQQSFCYVRCIKK